jgi:diguanylate cyclase (GGDEF)-like protein/PAS domain S-box-containing protein
MHSRDLEESQGWRDAPCAVHSLDRDGVFVQVNETLERWLGVRSEQVVGHLRLVDMLSPASRAAFREAERVLQEQGTVSGVELELRPPGGPPRRVVFAASALREDRALAMTRAVLLEAAEPRSESEHLQRFFSLSLDMLCIADFDGYFRQLNHAWTRTLGWTLDELLGKPFLDFVHPDDRDATTAEAAHLRSGRETVHFENRYRCRDGAYRWLLWTSAVSVEHRLFYAVARDMTERKQLEQQLRRAALYDPLTNLPNRTHVTDRLERLLSRRQHDGNGLAVLYVDLDGFKPINDQYGHAAGDEVLVTVSRRLERAVRPGDLVGRLGGDEFAIALDGVDSDAAQLVADRIQRHLGEVLEVDGPVVRPAASIGIVMAGTRHQRPLDLLREADAAMYRAKAGGKGRSAVL